MAQQIHLSDYFDTAYSAFERCESESIDSRDAYIRIAGEFVVRFRFSSSRLASFFLPALNHLAADKADRVDLTICVWDKSPKPPYPSWQGQRQYVNLLAGDRIKVNCELGPHRLSAIDLQQSIGLFWVSDIANIPGHERCSPFKTILNWWATARDHYLVHAAAIGTKDGGVLIVGPGGSGKSSTALSCIRPGFSYVSDDYCLVGFNGTDAYAASIYSCAKIDIAGSHGRFEHLRPHLISRHELHEKKEVLFVHEHFPELVVSNIPIRAVLVAKVADQCDTAVRRTSPDEAAKALIPSTMNQLPGSEIDSFFAMMRVTRGLPVYRIELGTDAEQIPIAISALLTEITAKQTFSTDPSVAPELVESRR